MEHRKAQLRVRRDQGLNKRSGARARTVFIGALGLFRAGEPDAPAISHFRRLTRDNQGWLTGQKRVRPADWDQATSPTHAAGERDLLTPLLSCSDRLRV